MAILEVEGIRKSFGSTQVLTDISFSLEKGESLAIIGSSGSGKTTLLRCLNFLEISDQGTIRVGDEVIFDATRTGPVSNAELRKNRLPGSLCQRHRRCPHCPRVAGDDGRTVPAPQPGQDFLQGRLRSS